MRQLPLHIWIAVFVFNATTAMAQLPTSVKNSLIREENPKGAKEKLIIPYAFSSETMGLTFGVGGMAKGYGQDQLLVAGTVYAGSNNEVKVKEDAASAIAGMWDLRLPYTKRAFFTATGSVGYFPRKRAYSAPAFDPDVPRPGSNASRSEQFLEVGGTDNWTDFRLEYVLPIGAAEDEAMMTYRLKNGMLVSKPTGRDKWNPLTSGVTNVLLRQFNRYQTYQFDPGDLERTIHPVQLGIAHDNTDFPANPSYGSRQFVGITQDFAWLQSDQTWTFWEVEVAKFFSLGDSRWARQRVLALDFWTGDSPSWNETVLPNGFIEVNNRPPYYEGATLGGFYRMRAYPFYRFNDRAAIYSSAEYRYNLRWNPIADVNWLKFLKLDWFQLAGFVEGGRVAREYTWDALTSNWKVDAGLGIRAMVAGGLVRFDIAGSEEGIGFWFMVGQPF